MNNRIFVKMTMLMALVSSLLFATSCKNEVKEEQKDTQNTTEAVEVMDKSTMTDKEIIDIVIDNFMPLTKVARPSHHEEKISAFLMDWATKEGFNPVQDKVNNVMFDVPATKGMEDKPLGALQGHMDMVVAVADGKDFDPLNDPIVAIRDDKEGKLTADGTSLGADDGAGVAIMMAVAQGKIAHGPLRMIITVDEEDGMDGAFNMSSSWFDGVTYLINIDNEWSDQVLVSTAAGDTIHADKKVGYANPTGNKAINIILSNLQGGHSGVEIDKGRLNGIIGLTTLFKQMDEEGINFELASMECGTAGNAIPAKAEAVIVINENDKTKVVDKVSAYNKYLNDEYKGIEENIKCEVTDVTNMPQVISKEERDNLIKFTTEVINGVYTMSKDMEGLVESSSNLGIAKLNKDGLSFVINNRSSSPEKEVEINDSQIALAKECGYEVTTAKSAEAWPFDPNSKLLELTKKIYKEQNGKDMEVVAVHAGLECGCFKKMKPDLEMISIGPDLTDGHTIKETLYLNSIPKIWKLLEGILSEYK